MEDDAQIGEPIAPWTYLNPELFDLEYEALFLKRWQFVGHANDVTDVGDYIEWHRDEDILGFDSETQFLIYGRWNNAELLEVVTGLLTDLDSDHPGLLGVFTSSAMLDHGGPHWRDPATAASFKPFVKRILAIA